MVARVRGSRFSRAVLLFAALLLLASAWSARQAWGRPVLGLFVDPFVDLSAAYLPTWPSSKWGLNGGQRLVAVRWAAPAARREAEGAPPRARVEAEGTAPTERVELRCEGCSALRRFDGAVAKARGQGARALVVEFEADGERDLELDARRFGVNELWWFWGLYVLAGLAMLWSGLTAYRMAGRRPGARAHLGLSVSTFVFFVTFLDYHTTRVLAPLFAASTVGCPIGFCALALYFPSPLPVSRRARAALAWAGAAAALLAIALGVGAAADRDWRGLRLLANVLLPASLFALALAIVLRFYGAKGVARKELASAMWGLVPGPLALAGLTFDSGPASNLLVPFAAVAFLLSVGYALIRHNILDTDQLLRRRLFITPVGLAGVVAAGCVWVLLRDWFMLDGVDGAKASLAAGLVALSVGGATVGVLWAVVERVAFNSGAGFRPTIEKLADELATSSDEGAIRVNLCILVQRWLGTDGVTFHEPPSGAGNDEPWAELAVGHSVLEQRPPGERLLFVPLRSSGELLGALCISPKAEGAPFAADELALLDTITSLGALGIHNARALRRIDELRRLEAEVNEGGQRLALDLLGAELAHEIAYPLNYFRHMLDRMAKGRPQQADDIETGREEVERLRRMVTALRKLRLPPLERKPLALAPLVGHVLALLRGPIEEGVVGVRVDIPPSIRVLADPDRTLQLLLNLVRNALQAVPPEGGRVEVRARADDGVVIEVRNDGDAIPEHLREAIFQPWVSTRPGGTGLGLAVTQRIAAGFGWHVSHVRDGPWTVFRIEAPLPSEPSHRAETGE